MAKGWKGREIRYVLIGGQYRQPLNFTFDALQAARTSLSRVDECLRQLATLAKDAGTGATGDATAAPEFAQVALKHFTAAMADDLNTPEALAALFLLVKETNVAHVTLKPQDAVNILACFEQMNRVLGLFSTDITAEEAVPEEVMTLLKQRTEARAAKQWQESDRLRDAIAALGWIVRDSKDGATVVKA